MWAGYLFSGTKILGLTYVRPLESRPAHPSPAKALPAMKVGEFFDTAQIKQPISRISRDPRRTILGEKMLINLPKRGRVAPTMTKLCAD